MRKAIQEEKELQLLESKKAKENKHSKKSVVKFKRGSIP